MEVGATTCEPRTRTARLPYSGKFSNGANFHIFRMLAPYLKIKTAKIERHGQRLEAQFEVLTMSLYSYFAEASKRNDLPIATRSRRPERYRHQLALPR